MSKPTLLDSVPVPDAATVRIGRLERKIEKLKQQLAAREELIKEHDEMMERYPHIKGRIDSFTKYKAELQRIRDLEARCKEQAALIILLQKTQA